MLPLLMLFLDPKLVIPASCLLGTVAVLSLVVKLWKQAKKELLLTLLIGNFIGVIIGTYGLVVLKSDLIRRVFAVLVALFAVQMFFERLYLSKPRLPNIVGVLAGWLGGLVGSLFGMGGPPVVWYLNRQTPDKSEFRATLISYFAFSTPWMLIVYGYADLFTGEVITFALYMLPAVIAGIIVGHLLHLRISKVLFQRVVALILLVTSICLFMV